MRRGRRTSPVTRPVAWTLPGGLVAIVVAWLAPAALHAQMSVPAEQIDSPGAAAPSSAPSTAPGGVLFTHFEFGEHAAAAEEAGREPEGVGVHTRVYWKDGFNYRFRWLPVFRPEDVLPFRPAGTVLSGRMGARLQVDAADYLSAGAVEDVPGGVEVRRFFLYTTGRLQLLHPILFRFEVGTKDQRFFLDNFYLWFADLPVVGNVKFGIFTAPFSMAEVTSSDYRTFMEVAAPVDAFAMGTKAGVEVWDGTADERVRWSLGWFADAQRVDVGDLSGSLSRVVGRVTWLPVRQEEAGQPRLLHLGLNVSQVEVRQTVRYRATPESNQAPALVDTGDVDARMAVPFGPEIAVELGPFALQAEFLGSVVDTTALGTRFVAGGYVSGSWVLTGEVRPYDTARGTFGTVVPARPLSLHPWSSGAWEAGLRFSQVDLDDGPVRGGRMNVVMTGLNWYWTRYVRWMAEYGFADVTRDATPGNGQLHVFQLRLQLRI